MLIGLSQRRRYSSFLDLIQETEEEDTEQDMIVRISVGRNLSQTVSHSAADLKILDTEDSLHASRGVVNEMMLAMHPSGNACRSSTSPVAQATIFSSALQLILTFVKLTDFLYFYCVPICTGSPFVTKFCFVCL